MLVKIRVVMDTEAVMSNPCNAGHTNNPFFFEGDCKLLDTEGEWCIDPQTRVGGQR